MNITRRTFLKSSVVGIAGTMMVPGLLAAETKSGKIRIAARFGDNFDGARKAGLDGLEVGVGGAADNLAITATEYRAKLKEKSGAAGVVISSLSMDLMNGHPAGTDPKAIAWLTQTIESAADLGATGILLPFFGAAELLQGGEFKKAEMEGLVGRLKEIAPLAKKNGVSIGIESTLTAAKYLELLDKVGSDAVGAYYDIGNSTGKGYDVPADIKALKGRLTMIHFKDGGNYLGEGKVKMEPICDAIKNIGYVGWIVLETSCPSGNGVNDFKKNADFSRKLLGIQPE